MKNDKVKCPECGAASLYRTTTNSGGGHGPMLLPELGRSFWRPFAKFQVVVCAVCGLTRFYAEPDARLKLPTADGWLPI